MNELYSFQQVVLNAAGYGTIQVGPHGESWHVATISCSASTNVLEATFNVYRGPVAVINRVDYSNTGSSGDITDTGYDLLDGAYLTFEWVGGDAGATGTALVRGTRDSFGGGGFRAI